MARNFVFVFLFLGILPLVPQVYGQTVYKVYIDPLPAWAEYAQNAFNEAASFWQAQNPDIRFEKVSTVQDANIAVRWIKEFAQQHAGLAYSGFGTVEVGLGNSNCDGQWHQFSSKYVADIMKHEIGHVLFGPEHSTDPNSIMYEGPLSSYGYGPIKREFSLAPNYGQYFPLCSGLSQITSFAYYIRSDEPTYGFDVYFAPSPDEFENFVQNRPINYYSPNLCSGEDNVLYSGKCDGIRKGGILLFIMPPKLTKSLTNIVVNIEEFPSSQTTESSLAVRAVQTTGQYDGYNSWDEYCKANYSPTHYYEQSTHECIDSAAKAEESPLFPSISGTVRVENDIYELSSSEIITAYISGQISNSVQGTSVFLFVQTPSSYIHSLETTVDENGFFSVPFDLMPDYQAGAYVVSAKYEDNYIGSTIFYVTAKEAPILSPVSEKGGYLSSGEILVEGTDFFIPYTISGGSVTKTVVQPEYGSILVSLDVKEDGEVELSLPRELIDSKTEEGDDDFFYVLVDGREFNYQESTTDDQRILTIFVPANTQEIEIIGTYVVPEFNGVAVLVLIIGIMIVFLATKTVSKPVLT